MTARQSILKRLYPILTGITRMTGSKNASYRTDRPVEPPKPFHSLKATLITGEALSLDSLKGKMVLLVNTASDCGYTPQYEGLQQLQDRYRDRLVVVGFPANDFKQQEKGGNAQIAEFCKRNYGVNFLLTEKSSVVKGPEQHTVFAWLSDSRLNGWNNRQPVWNFTKYLVDQQGRLVGVFEPSVDPLGDELTSVIDQKR
ncbi:MAG: glutathione peroxidase [Chitinophagia bacterium]|nr:glutathione peroxidase [Chitinophagia bacterium]